jgi:hypothetical protein
VSISVFPWQLVILLLNFKWRANNESIIQGKICHTKNSHIINIKLQHYAIRSMKSFKFILRKYLRCGETNTERELWPLMHGM